ncbi:hypothetical protein HPP92_011026 [Vanilla planifolia]|uniref:Uncharacterized protein n=1 Tax=Vanilla planifolia TaxID=51239 RepID=A0A835R581_VANPL|nr:hypothetical protein HPP92_011026 [Vanilla planifolia]
MLLNVIHRKWKCSINIIYDDLVDSFLIADDTLFSPWLLRASFRVNTAFLGMDPCRFSLLLQSSPTSPVNDFTRVAPSMMTMVHPLLRLFISDFLRLSLSLSPSPFLLFCIYSHSPISFKLLSPLLHNFLMQ